MKNVAIDDKGVGTYTFENLTQDHTVEVTFQCFKGDIDGDGIVGLKDVIWGLRILAGEQIGKCPCIKADLGEVIDVLKLLAAK